MKKTVSILIALVMVFTIFSACGVKKDSDSAASSMPASSGSSTGDASGAKKVVFIAQDMKATYSSWLAQSLEEIQTDYPSIDLQILDGANDVNTQMDQIENSITQKVDLILLQSADSGAIATTVQKTIEGGTPIVIVNQGTGGVDSASNVDSDPIEQGQIVSEVAKEKIPQNGKVVVLLGPSGNVHSAGRLEGFEKYLLAERPDIEILDTQIGNWYKDEGMRIMEDWLQRFPEIDAVLSMNDAMALGAIEAAKAVNRKEEMTYYGVDGLADACLSIQAGDLTATCVQNAYAQAETAMQVANKVLSGEIEHEIIMVPGELITLDNVEKWIEVHTANGQIK